MVHKRKWSCFQKRVSRQVVNLDIQVLMVVVTRKNTTMGTSRGSGIMVLLLASSTVLKRQGLKGIEGVRIYRIIILAMKATDRIIETRRVLRLHLPGQGGQGTILGIIIRLSSLLL